MNVSKRKTPAGVAKMVHKHLQRQAKKIGADPNNVLLWDPETAAQKGWSGSAEWQIAWEEGPGEWAPAISAGEKLYAFELQSYGDGPEIEGLVGHAQVLAEPYNSWLLCFFKN
jgi:hypothetical protein